MSNRTNLSTSYHYTVTAATDNSAYLWSGHGLENAPNPTIYLRTDDDIKITNASGGHIMELRYDPDPGAWTAVESNGEINIESPNPGSLLAAASFTYICQTHPAMTGKVIISQPDVDGKPDDGYGTGPLPENKGDGTRASVSVNQIRTKINEIVTKGGIGGGSISVSDVPPDNPSEGDLWFDETAAALYVWIADPTNSWIQTSGGGGGGSIEVSDTAPTTPANGDLWFNTTNGQLYVYVASETAWFQTNGGSGGGGGEGASVTTGDTAPATPADGDLWFNTVQAELYVYLDAEGGWVQTNGGGGAGSGGFTTGWVNTDGATAVANGAKMQFNHNLGTTDVLVEVWAADDINGTNNNRLSYSGHDTGATIRYGAAVHGVTNNTIGVVLGTYGYIDEQGDLSQAPTGVHQFTDKYIKVVVLSGAGSGPRAYVAFDGTAADLTASITNSPTVASITDI